MMSKNPKKDRATKHNVQSARNVGDATKTSEHKQSRKSNDKNRPSESIRQNLQMCGITSTSMAGYPTASKYTEEETFSFYINNVNMGRR